MDRNVYALRIKPSGRDHTLQVLAEDQIAIGWSEARSLLQSHLTRNDFRAILHKIYHSDTKNFSRSGHAASNMWRFIRELRQGDIVVIPHEKSIYLAEVSDDIAIHREEMIGNDTCFRRNIVRLLDGEPILYDKLSPKLISFLSFRNTSINLQRYRDEILQLIGGSDLLLVEAAASIDHRAIEVIENPEYALAQIRPEQALFRQKLREIYGDRCCLTGTKLTVVLQAAHIIPHRDGGPDINHPRNGLLLRADIHLLFDALLLSIEPGRMEIKLAESVKKISEYRQLEGRRVVLQADRKLVAAHYDRFCKRSGITSQFASAGNFLANRVEEAFA